MTKTTTAEEPSRWERKRRQRVDGILSVAAEEIAERGYHNTSLDDIAERLDLAKASLYHYFPSKDDLVLAALDMCAYEVNTEIETIAAGDGTPSDRLYRMIAAQIRALVVEHRESGRLFLLLDTWPPEIGRKVSSWRKEHDQLFRSVIDEGLARGDFAVPDPDLARQLMHGAINHTPAWLRPNQLTDERLTGIADELMRLFRA